MIRYLEDYSFLSDTSNKINFHDPIKYLPLSKNNTQRYVSIGGEVRFLYERVTSTYIRKKNVNDYLLSRLMLHTDWHWSKSLRLFAQLGSTWENGRTGGPRPIDEDHLFVHQMFSDIVLGRTKIRNRIRIGRQEVNLGSGRLVTIREGPNTRLSFDGIRIITNITHWTLSSFYLRPVNNQIGVFDNEIFEDGEELWGIYFTKMDQMINFDLFFLGYFDEDARYHNAEGKEKRFTLGTRIFGMKNGFDFDLEAGYQFGKMDQNQGSGNIRAYGGGVNAGYTLHNTPLKPRLGMKIDYISGDRDSTDLDLGSVNVLFPKQGYFRGAAAFAAVNLSSIHPELSLNFNKQASLVVDYAFFWRTSLADGVYAPNGSPTNPLARGDSRFLGGQLDFEFNWQITRHIGVLAVYSKFFAGSAIQENPHPSENNDFLNLRIGYKF